MMRIGILLFCVAQARADTISPLYARGYTVMPQPQGVQLGPADFAFSGDWKLELQGARPDDIAVKTLEEELHMGKSGQGAGTLRLVLAPNSAKVGQAQDRQRDALTGQAYKIDLGKDRIVVAANAPAGLFYGVVTLIQ